MAKPDYFPIDCAESLENIGIQVALRRHSMQMRQVDLARKAEISVPTLKKIEAGSPTVEAGILVKVLWQLGLLHELIHAPRPDAEALRSISGRVRLPGTGKDYF